MFIWVNKKTLGGCGFSRSKSIDPNHISFPVDEPTFNTLTQNPGKLRWAHLISEPSRQYVRFLIPTPVTRTQIRPIKVSAQEVSETIDLAVRVDASDFIQAVSKYDLPKSLHLVVCKGSVFNVKAMCALTRMTSRHIGLRDLIEEEEVRIFLSGVPINWTTQLLVQE
jgi:hypothetical protein